MKVFILFFIVILTSLGVISCKNHESGKKQEIKQDTTALKYNKDSSSDEVAVIIFNQNGEPEYIKANPDKVFQKTESGLEYKYIQSGKTNKYPKVGDVLYLDMTYKTETDSILFKSRDIDKDFKMRLEVPSHSGGCIEQAFMMMKEGDSAVFKIDAINFFTQTQGKVTIPYYIKKGDKLIFNIKLVKIVDGSDYIKENADMYAFYINQENSLIDRYILSFDYQCVTKESGLRIMTIKKGTGKKANKGNSVTINYTAGFIDGSVFDSTIERNQPFSFTLGSEEVIEGLDEGISNMNVGDHCIFIVPFRLAYGDEKSGIIPPYSTLVFEVELVDAK